MKKIEEAPLNILLVFFFVVVVGVRSEGRVFCLHESFNATCRTDPQTLGQPFQTGPPVGPPLPKSLILITSAVYGRMRLGRCINGDFNVGCSMDVTSYLDSQCSARESCDVSVRNLVDIHPCQRDFMSYLEASYVCIEAHTSRDLDLCPAEQKLVYGAHPNGRIVHESMLIHHVIGSVECPWGVRAHQGQRIRLKVIVIGDENTQPGNYDEHVTCSETYVISDVIEGSSTEVNACSGTSRERTLYVSSSHEISFFVTRPRDHQVSVDDLSDDVTGADQSKESSQDGEAGEARRRRRATVKFIVSYEAVGCPDLLVPQGATMRRNQDTLVIKCNETLETWYLTCQETRWIGDVGNCSQRIFLAVLLGIGLGIIIGMFLLLLVHCARRKALPTNKQVLQGLMSNIRKESDLDFEAERAAYGCVSLIEPQAVNNCFSMTSSSTGAASNSFDFPGLPEAADCLKNTPMAFTSGRGTKSLRRQKQQQLNHPHPHQPPHQHHPGLPYSAVQYDDCCPTCAAHCRERQCLIADVDEIDCKSQEIESQSNSSRIQQQQQQQQQMSSQDQQNSINSRGTLDRKSLYESMVYPLGLRTPEGLYSVNPNPQSGGRQHQRNLPATLESYCQGDVRIV